MVLPPGWTDNASDYVPGGNEDVGEDDIDCCMLIPVKLHGYEGSAAKCSEGKAHGRVSSFQTYYMHKFCRALFLTLPRTLLFLEFSPWFRKDQHEKNSTAFVSSSSSTSSDVLVANSTIEGHGNSSSSTGMPQV